MLVSHPTSSFEELLFALVPLDVLPEPVTRLYVSLSGWNFVAEFVYYISTTYTKQPTTRSAVHGLLQPLAQHPELQQEPNRGARSYSQIAASQSRHTTLSELPLRQPAQEA